MAATGQVSSFEIGRVVQITFGVLRRNFLSFMILAGIFIGGPSLVVQLCTYLTGAANDLTRRAAITALGLIASVLGAVILQAAVVTGTLGDLNGRPIGVREMISARAPAVPALLGLAIVQAIITGVGFVLLLVPGMILMAVWSVTVPTIVIEKTGVFEAFSRSAQLTRGHRWSIFGLFMLYFVLVMVFDLVGLSLVGGAGAFSAGSNGVTTTGLIIFIVAYAALTGAVSATGLAVIYQQLRLDRDGVAPQSLLDTFA